MGCTSSKGMQGEGRTLGSSSSAPLVNSGDRQAASAAAEARRNAQRPQVSSTQRNPERQQPPPTQRSPERQQALPTQRSPERQQTSPTQRSSGRQQTSPTQHSPEQQQTSPTQRSPERQQTSPTQPSVQQPTPPPPQRVVQQQPRASPSTNRPARGLPRPDPREAAAAAAEKRAQANQVRGTVGSNPKKGQLSALLEDRKKTLPLPTEREEQRLVWD
ncbi:hypothetical protein FRB94_006857 [Tulasnella sp. JGI-2019a]|nr:hypothetical protein FRB94_006857 [Tulasnella sp. JGI-2019a]